MNLRNWFSKKIRKSSNVSNLKSVSPSSDSSDENSSNIASGVIKHLRPKILLLDVNDEMNKALQEKGYNVSSGSLGNPYLVPQNSSVFVVDREFSLPYDYKEHEIVIIDLDYEPENRRDNFQGGKREPGIDEWWVSHGSGKVNPRLLNSYLSFDNKINTF